MIAYANYEDKALVETRFASLVTVFMIGLMLMHLLNLVSTIRYVKKDITILRVVGCPILW